MSGAGEQVREGERPEREADEADEDATAAPAAEGVRVEASPVRCPFCHEGVRVEDADWVACAHCLARHHDACWGEAGRCGACGAGERLARAGRSAQASPPTSSPAGASITLPPLAPEAPLGRAARLFGGPRRLAFTRTIPGEVGPPEGGDLDEAVVGAARAKLDEMGRFERLGRTLTWTTVGARQGAQRAVTVTVASRDGQTVVDVREDLGQLAGGLYGGLGGGLGGGGQGLAWGAVLGITQSLGLAAATSVALVLFALALARTLFVRATARRREALRELSDTVSREVAARVRAPRPDPKKEAS